ncbi:hypothetical protein ACIQBJ_29265 [Kitasatospora sp. NPDC088391]|uniref:hypothetical protein n=1 Tax=Kitasatospora sp. NPDC088391 TaxID=3364074 RepID=UPI003802ED55
MITAPVFLRVAHPHGDLPPALSVLGLDIEYAETACSTCEAPAPEQFGQQLGDLICAAENRLHGSDC